jgi:carbonic anhydrase
VGAVAAQVAGEDKLRKPFDPSGLLPETRMVFRYTYTGSLTTQSCIEGVMWNMMRRAMSDSKAHLDELARHHTHNARELQPLGDRKIL